jgi:NAD(P)-dependent dehydrogenase (short-subunit alcohol dehydrogenase family)
MPNMSGKGPLSGQHAIVTGGGRGIGAAIAAELARMGADLTLMGRSLDALQARSAELAGAHPVRVGCVELDVTLPDSIRRAFLAAREVQGPPAILVNNAGGAESAPFLKTDPKIWEAMLELNLTGPYLCTREALPDMLAEGYGRVVNVASTAGLRGYPYVSAYAASKHGLIGLTRSKALELATKGVTVNAVCPGFADTELTARSTANIVAKTGRTPEQARAELERLNPQGRLVQPAEVAGAVGWLCLPESGAVTGQAIVVAGGEVT